MARRRGRGEGSIGRRTEDGLWYARIDLGRDAAGKRRSRTVYSRTRRGATEKLQALLHDRRLGLPVAADRQTIDAFLDRLAPYLAGDELTFAAFADVDAQERLLEVYAERFGIDRTRGLDFVASVRRALAAGEAEVESDYEPAPDAVEMMEAAMLPYVREHKDELDAAEARRGARAINQTMERLDDWILPAVTTTPEFVERYFFLMDRFITDESLAAADLESAWQEAHRSAD